MKVYWGSGSIAPRILDLGIRWRWVVSLTLWSPYSQQKSPLVPIGYEAGWAPEPVRTRWWRDKFPAPAGTRTPDDPTRSPGLYHWTIILHFYNLVATEEYFLFHFGGTVFGTSVIASAIVTVTLPVVITVIIDKIIMNQSDKRQNWRADTSECYFGTSLDLVVSWIWKSTVAKFMTDVNYFSMHFLLYSPSIPKKLQRNVYHNEVSILRSMLVFKYVRHILSRRYIEPIWTNSPVDDSTKILTELRIVILQADKTHLPHHTFEGNHKTVTLSLHLNMLELRKPWKERVVQK
jgi:hypothetical protein